MTASASHDGYDALRGSPRHDRQVSVRNGGPLVIRDRVVGGGLHRIEAGFLLAPGWTVLPQSSGWDLFCDGKRLRVLVQTPAHIQFAVTRRPWHPEFGLEVQTNRLTWRWEGPLPIEATTIVSPR